MDTLTSADGHAFCSLEEHVGDQPGPGWILKGVGLISREVLRSLDVFFKS